MTLLSRFLTSYRGEDVGALEEPGLVQNDDGTVDVIRPDGTRGRVGNGGSSPVIQMPPVTLDDATIKALPTTSDSPPYGFEFLASPGPGTVLLPVAGLLVKYGAAYTNVNAAAALTIAYSGYVSTDMSPQVQCGGGNFLDTLLDETAVLPLTGWGILSAVPAMFPAGLPSPLTGIDGLGLILSANNHHSGDFTGGDPANRLVVHLLYTVLTL